MLLEIAGWGTVNSCESWPLPLSVQLPRTVEPTVAMAVAFSLGPGGVYSACRCTSIDATSPPKLDSSKPRAMVCCPDNVVEPPMPSWLKLAWLELRVAPDEPLSTEALCPWASGSTRVSSWVCSGNVSADPEITSTVPPSPPLTTLRPVDPDCRMTTARANWVSEGATGSGSLVGKETTESWTACGR